jgi:hypothetical protein
MGYWKAKSDLEFIREFKGTALNFLLHHEQRGDLINNTAWQRLSEEQEKALTQFKIDYLQTRQKYVKSIDRASALASAHGVPYVLRLSPPPAIGGYVRDVNTFQALLEELPWGVKVDSQRVIDLIHQTEAACEQQVSIERRRLYNPFYWILELITFVLRIPFLIIQTSGFHIEKFEEQFWGRMFKLLELFAIIWFMIWVGATKPQIKEAVFNFLHISQAVSSTEKNVEHSLPKSQGQEKPKN